MQIPLNSMPMPKLLIEKSTTQTPQNATWYPPLHMKECRNTSNCPNYFFCVVNTTLFLPTTDVRTTRGEGKREGGESLIGFDSQKSDCLIICKLHAAVPPPNLKIIGKLACSY